MLPSIPHAFATTAEFWCVNRWCKGSYESKDKKKSIFLTLLNEVKPLVINFSEIHDWVTTSGKFFLSFRCLLPWAAALEFARVVVHHYRRQGRRQVDRTIFVPIFRCFQKWITRRLHAGNTARSLTQKFASITNLGGFQSSSRPVSLSCITGREEIPGSLSNIGNGNGAVGVGGVGGGRAITINSDRARLQKAPALVLWLQAVLDRWSRIKVQL